MPDWIALHEWLVAPETAVEASTAEIDEPWPTDEPEPEPEPIGENSDDLDALLADVRFFRAALAEAIELRAQTLAQEIAVDVLARELRTSPADLARVIQSACARYYSDTILAIRVHPDDVTLLCAYERVVSDPNLRPGDAVIELSEGTIDATLGVRLERVLRAGRT